MLVSIKKNTTGLWSVMPLEGRFANSHVGVTEAIRLSNAYREGETLVGTAESVWGLTTQVNLDSATLQGLVGRRTPLLLWGFRRIPIEKVRVERSLIASYDGVHVR